MKLNPAPRVAHGRCAAPADTLARLEATLARFDLQYQEHAVGDALYWGSAELAALDFPPMGKGTSARSCKISTLAETVEWLALKRRRALAGERLEQFLPVEALLPHIAEVPETVNELPLAQHWVDAWEVNAEEAISVPLEYVQAISGTNGLAAGNVLEEAIVQGINEVFERRAAITVIKNRMVLPSIDPASIADEALQQQLADIRALGVELTLKDLSFGGALPCVGVYFVDPSVPPMLQVHHAFKVAAHFDRGHALSSCLSEYVQLRRVHAGNDAAHEQMETDDATDNFLPLFWFGYVPFANAAFLQEGEVIPFDPGVAYPDCLDDIQYANALLQQLGLELIVVDLSDPEIDFPVVQVVVPGYSDILPYHPASSSVLTKGWTRDLPMGYSAGQPITAGALFPGW